MNAMNSLKTLALSVALVTSTFAIAAEPPPVPRPPVPAPPPVPPVPAVPDVDVDIDDFDDEDFPEIKVHVDAYNHALDALERNRERMQRKLSKLDKLRSFTMMSERDALGANLFPPDLIMQHQVELGLDDKTRGGIVEEVQKFQASVVKIEWDMKASAQQLAKLLSEDRVDEAKTLATSDKLMSLERELKRAHLTMLVRVKNKLTAEQQKKLRAARSGDWPFEMQVLRVNDDD